MGCKDRQPLQQPQANDATSTYIHQLNNIRLLILVIRCVIGAGHTNGGTTLGYNGQGKQQYNNTVCGVDVLLPSGTVRGELGSHRGEYLIVTPGKCTIAIVQKNVVSLTFPLMNSPYVILAFVHV